MKQITVTDMQSVSAGKNETRVQLITFTVGQIFTHEIASDSKHCEANSTRK